LRKLVTPTCSNRLTAGRKDPERLKPSSHPGHFAPAPVPYWGHIGG